MIHSQSHPDLAFTAVFSRLAVAGGAIVVAISAIGYAWGGHEGLHVAAICALACVAAGGISAVPAVALSRLAADGLVKGFMLSMLLRLVLMMAAVVAMIRIAGVDATAVVSYASGGYLAVLAAEAWALVSGAKELAK